MKGRIKTYLFRDSVGGYFSTLSMGEKFEFIGLNTKRRFESRYAAQKSAEKRAREIAKAIRKRRNDELRIKASNEFQSFSLSEDEHIRNRYKPDRELARMFQRSLSAIRARRKQLRK